MNENVISNENYFRNEGAQINVKPVYSFYFSLIFVRFTKIYIFYLDSTSVGHLIVNRMLFLLQ